MNNSSKPDAKYSGRAQKSCKITAILHDFLGQELSELIALDVGCATGEITSLLAENLKMIVGVEIDWDAIRQARNRDSGTRLAFVNADGTRLPVPDDFFDIIICAQVYEHTEDQVSLPKEIRRVLCPGGVCFFSGPNRLAIIEEHYWLPFLSWLPQGVANRYMRLFGKGPVYDIKPLYYWQLRKQWGDFTCHDYTIRMLKEPTRFCVQDKLAWFGWISKLPTWVIRIFTIFLPNYNWILEKAA